MEDLSVLLGHNNILTTQIHYNASVPKRRERLGKIAEESFQKEEPVGLKEKSEADVKIN